MCAERSRDAPMRRGASIANSGQRLRDFFESLCISSIAPGSSSPGRTSIQPSLLQSRP